MHNRNRQNNRKNWRNLKSIHQIKLSRVETDFAFYFGANSKQTFPIKLFSNHRIQLQWSVKNDIEQVSSFGVISKTVPNTYLPFPKNHFPQATLTFFDFPVDPQFSTRKGPIDDCNRSELTFLSFHNFRNENRFRSSHLEIKGTRRWGLSIMSSVTKCRNYRRSDIAWFPRPLIRMEIYASGK